MNRRHHLTSDRANMNTAANSHARWLFPGGRPGQPLTDGAFRRLSGS